MESMETRRLKFCTYKRGLLKRIVRIGRSVRLVDLLDDMPDLYDKILEMRRTTHDVERFAWCGLYGRLYLLCGLRRMVMSAW